MSILRNIRQLTYISKNFQSRILQSHRHYARAKWISITVVSPNGSKAKLKGEVDTTVLDVIRDNLVVDDYGVCGGSPGCTTCHVIFSADDYAKLSELPDETEKSLLECALDVTPTVNIVIQKGDEEITLKGKTGESILDVVVSNEVEISGYGACEGTLSCSTCHVKLSKEDFDRLPDKASDEELDMLDLAPDVCATSRLGCQIFLEKNLEGLKVQIPSVVKDMREFPGGSTTASS